MCTYILLWLAFFLYVVPLLPCAVYCTSWLWYSSNVQIFYSYVESESKNTRDWTNCTAMNKLMQSIPQSNPGIPVQTWPTFSSTTSSIHQSTSPSCNKKLPPTLSCLTAQKCSTVTVPTASSSITTASLIPSSLQHLVQANISSSLSRSQGSSETGQLQCHSTSTSISNTNRPNINPFPLSIKSTTDIPLKPSDEVQNTPLTPLSPYSSQQGTQKCWCFKVRSGM